MRDLKGLWRFPGDFLQTFSNVWCNPCDSCQIQAKRLEILRDLIPTVRTVGFVFDPETPREDIEPTARRHRGGSRLAATEHRRSSHVLHLF
jgi:hypothetical protein